MQGVHRTTPLLFGAKGPPLITFFLIFPTPKGIVRTSGMATTTVNMIGRIMSYGLTKPPQIDDYWTRNGLENSNSWFVREDWPLYAAMAVLSLFGCYLGTKLHDRIKADRFDHTVVKYVLVFVPVPLYLSVLLSLKINREEIRDN